MFYCCVEEKVLTWYYNAGSSPVHITVKNPPQDIDGGEVQLDCGPEHLLDLAEAVMLIYVDANGLGDIDFQTLQGWKFWVPS